VGCVVAAAVAVIVAIVLVLIAFYYIRNSGEHDTQKPKPQQTLDHFGTNLTAMPRFTGSML